MRVLLVSHFYSSHGGGIEFVAETLALELSRRGHQIQWVATDVGEGLPKNVDVLPAKGTNLVERILGLPYPLWIWWEPQKLVRAIRTSDIIHIHDGVYPGNQICFWIARLFRKKVVVTQHVGLVPTGSAFLNFLNRAANKLLVESILKRANAAVFISQVVREYFRLSMAQTKVLTIFNGLDSSIFHPDNVSQTQIRLRLKLPCSRPLILFVGRFVEKKGLHLIRIAAERNPDACFVLVGKGPINPASWGLPNVLVNGQIERQSLPDWYRAADFLLLPSTGEGFPLVVQEAMACGLPCAIFHETWLAWGEGKENFIILKANSGDWDFKLILHRSQNQAFRKLLAEYAIKTWSWQRTTKEYEDLYLEVRMS